MSFEKNLRRFSRVLPSTPPPPSLHNRVKRELPASVRPALLPRFIIAHATVRKSATSRADRPANALPPFALPARAAKALRLSTLVLLNTMVLGGIVGGGWWWHVNQAPFVRLSVPTVLSPNGYAVLVAATGKMRSEGAVSGAMSRPTVKARAVVKTALGTKEKKEYTLAEKAALVAENAEALEALRTALKVPAQVPPRRDWNTFPKEPVRFRQMTRLLLLEGQVRDEKKQYDKAANAFLTAMELGERIGHGGTLINKLTALSCEDIGRRHLFPLSAHLSPADACAAIRRLEDIQKRRVGMEDSLAEEKRLTRMELNRQFQTQNYWQIAGTFARDYVMPREDGEPAKPSLMRQGSITQFPVPVLNVDNTASLPSFWQMTQFANIQYWDWKLAKTPVARAKA